MVEYPSIDLVLYSYTPNKELDPGKLFLLFDLFPQDIVPRASSIVSH